MLICTNHVRTDIVNKLPEISRNIVTILTKRNNIRYIHCATLNSGFYLIMHISH